MESKVSTNILNPTDHWGNQQWLPSIVIWPWSGKETTDCRNNALHKSSREKHIGNIWLYLCFNGLQINRNCITISCKIKICQTYMYFSTGFLVIQLSAVSFVVVKNNCACLIYYLISHHSAYNKKLFAYLTSRLVWQAVWNLTWQHVRKDQCKHNRFYIKHIE